MARKKPVKFDDICKVDSVSDDSSEAEEGGPVVSPANVEGVARGPGAGCGQQAAALGSSPSTMATDKALKGRSVMGMTGT